jgi:hypothetical protein
MQQWHSVITPTCRATEIDNILIALIALKATTSQLKTTNLPNLDKVPTDIKDLDTLAELAKEGDKYCRRSHRCILYLGTWR